MRVFLCPARYLRVVESSLALTLAEIKRDMSNRDSDDPVVRGLALLPDALIDHGETGDLVVAVVLRNSLEARDSALLADAPLIALTGT